jgi:TM2 domain-containing membrane protein YozV
MRMSEESWYYAEGAEQRGPLPGDQFRQLVHAGAIHPETLVWREGMANWSPAGTIPGLLPAAAMAIPANPVGLESGTAGPNMYPGGAQAVGYAAAATLAYARPPMRSAATLSDVHAMMRFEANKKSILVAYLLWWFFGMFGGHRFYLGRTESAVAMLIITLVSIPLMFVLIGFVTIWISAIWAIVDAFLIPGICRQYNNDLANRLAAPGWF